MKKNWKNITNEKAALTATILGLLIVLGSQEVCRSDNITINLNFPQKSSARISGVKPVLAPIEVCGSITLSISPYPNVSEANQCKVKYYINEELLYETVGIFVSGLEPLNFKYKFDTTKFENGEYRLYVNYINEQGALAIGSQKIIIINQHKSEFE